MSLTKEQFDNLYVGEKLVVHCDTEDKAKEFLKLANEFGYNHFLNEFWNIYKLKMCYYMLKNEYCDKDYYELNGYTVVTYPQHPKQFTKSDLKSGDKIVYRNNNERYVLVETNTIHFDNGRIDFNLDNWTNELLDYEKAEGLDIMKVYRNDILIWVRYEEPKKTARQIEIERIEKEMREIADRQSKLADELSQLKK